MKWIAVVISLVVIGATYNHFSPRAKASSAIALDMKAQCDALAAQRGYKCQGVIVVLK